MNEAHPKTRYSVISVLWLLLLAACHSDIEKIKIVTQDDSYPTEKGVNIEMTYTDSGIIKARVFSPLIERYEKEKPYTEMKKGLTCYFYNTSTRRAESMLRARYAIRYQLEKRTEAKDSVMMVNTKGDTLTTEQLIWDEEKHRIYTDKFFTLRKPDEILYGDGFESNEDFSSYKIFKLRGTIKLDDHAKAD